MFQSVVATNDVETALTNFTPTKTATLIGIEIILAGQAATSLMEGGYIKMSCPTFGGVDLYCGFAGNGLRTAPATTIHPAQHVCILPVSAGTPVKGYINWNVLAVTPEVYVYGIFEG